MKTTSSQQFPSVLNDPLGADCVVPAWVALLDRFAPRRRSFTKAARTDYYRTVIKRYDGYCPCCKKNKLIDRFGGFIEGQVQLDHFNGPDRNTVDDGMRPVQFALTN